MEQELGRQKDKEIERITQELEEHTAIVREQKEEIAQYSIYQKFMEKVLDYSDEVRGNMHIDIGMGKPSKFFCIYPWAQQRALPYSLLKLNTSQIAIIQAIVLTSVRD